MADQGPAVEFRHVSKRYGPAVAVNDVSFEIERGTLVTLLGPSGCGKTSTLRLVAGLEQPSEGQVFIGGRDVTAMSAAERDVSMVFQSYALFPHMTVLENVCYGLRASGTGKARAAEMAAEKLAAVGLRGFEARLPSELSGGQQQRVAVARAIVLEPQVLLFDEPLSNLDAKLRRQVREDIRALQRQLRLTVVYVTHDQEEALAVSDRIIVMHSAQIVQDGSPRDLYEQPANAFIADFIGNANLVPVELGATQGGLAEVRLGGVTLHLPGRGLPPGPAQLAVRPNGFALLAGAAGGNAAPGTVRKAAYLGSHMEYEVAIDGVAKDVLVVMGDVAAPLAAGDVVGVSVLPGCGGRGAVTDIAARQRFALGLAVERTLAASMRQALGPIEAKSPIDFCTEADRAVERLVTGRLRERFGDGVIGEEYGGEASGSVWVVDPIDGTTEYIHGTRRWCVSMAYVRDGVIEAGVIYAPGDDRLFGAVRGGGAALNGRAMGVSRLAHGAVPVIEVGWSDRRPIAAYAEVLTRLCADGMEFRRHGSGALALAEVAAGLSDGYVELHINAWDALAGILLVTEAGGRCNDFLADGGLVRGNKLVAATPEVWERVMVAAG